MIKRICFFSGGFAFNRLVRMRFYEKIFPRETEIFLFTTNKYSSIEECKKQWDLKRTKVFVDNYSMFKTPFNLRKFCEKNKIQRLVNLGAPGAGIPFLIATLLTDRDYLIGYYGEVFKHKLAKNFSKSLAKLFVLFHFFLVAKFAKKLVFTDMGSYKKAQIFFLSSRKKVSFGAAPVDTKFFVQKKRSSARKKLNLPKDKKIVIRVGRINKGKCADILLRIAEKNKEVYFILVGEWFEKEIPKVEKDNVLYVGKKSSKDLVDYYSASDLSFCLHRHGNGIGIAAEEALACGVPVILPNALTMPKSQAVVLTSYSVDEINNKIKKLFSLSKKEREKISREARSYAEKYCSNKVWKQSFLDFHLNA